MLSWSWTIPANVDAPVVEIIIDAGVLPV